MASLVNYIIGVVVTQTIKETLRKTQCIMSCSAGSSDPAGFGDPAGAKGGTFFIGHSTVSDRDLDGTGWRNEAHHGRKTGVAFCKAVV